MNILMMTNTYLPHVGGVARSVYAFSRQYQALGHKVLVVAPEFEDANDNNSPVDVIRIPAIRRFNGSDFSVVWPLSPLFSNSIQKFSPDIVHSHHPFLIGSTALRTAALFGVPHVFTHHTMYEQYTHYVAGSSSRLKSFSKRLATHYANLCDHVFAPCLSIADLLKSRGVNKCISVVPTGVNLSRFENGDAMAFRMARGIPQDAFVVGHVSRLAKEKNLPYLARSIADFLQQHQNAVCLIVGTGAVEKDIMRTFSVHGVRERVVFTGVLSGQELIDAYKSMNVFVFASKSETQGMVLIEAMAAGVPVLALDANGVRDVIKDNKNGRLLAGESEQCLSDAIKEFHQLPMREREAFVNASLATAEEYSSQRIASRALSVYQRLIRERRQKKQPEHNFWEGILPLINTEWGLVKSYADSAGGSILRMPNKADSELHLR